jgi:hypothetical protein
MDRLDALKLAELETRLTPHPVHLREALLNGAVASFNEFQNPARFINTGNLLRELLRELFVAVSPDESVKRCGWYTPDPTSKSGVTRRHRTLFAVYSYLDPEYFPEDFVSEVEELAAAVARQVGKLSSFAHPTATSLGKPAAASVGLFNEALELFLALFDAINSAREHVLDALQADLQTRLPDLFTNEFFDDLDCLSTHTRPQDADGIEVEITKIGEEAIKFTGTGRVYCDLQYGSDGDCARGDGVEWKDSFPFKFAGEAPISEPDKASVEIADVEIDTSSSFDATAYE